jgi:CHAT domain-containing protein
MLAAAFVGLWLPGCARRQDPPSLARLAEILHHRRIVEPRLSGGFDHGPCRTAASGGSVLGATTCSSLPRRGTSDAVDLARLTRALQSQATATGRPALLHAEGVAFLVQAGSRWELDHAVESLVKAAALAPHEAETRSDLAAAYLVRAERFDAPHDLVLALARAHEAIACNPGLPEARFNLALALDKLRLRSGAAAAWEAFVALEPRSGWAQEAHRHLAALAGKTAEQRWSAQKERLQAAASRGDANTVREVVHQFPQAVRLYAEEELLPDWADLHAAGSETAARGRLEQGRLVGAALAATGGDTLVGETVADIDSAYAAKSDKARLAGLTAGLREYRLGLAAYQRNDLDVAGRRFRAAGDALRRLHCGFHAAAELYLAILSYQREAYPAALAQLRRIRDDPEQRRHLNLIGRTEWLEGSCHVSQARPLEAVAAFRRALKVLAATGEEETAVTVHAMLGEVLGQVGEEGEAWSQRFAALRGLPGLRNPRRRHTTLGAAAVTILRLGEPVAARDFQDEAVAAARESGNPLDIAEALRVRAAIAVDLGEPDQARTDLKKVEEIVGPLDPHLREAVLGEVREVESRALRSSDPQKAIASERAAIDLFRRTHYQGRLAMSYLELALTELVAGDGASGENALRAGIAAQEDEWRHLARHLQERTGDEVWPTYFDRRRELFDQWISLLAKTGRSAEAFDGAERAHAWELLLQVLEMPQPPVVAAAAAQAGERPSRGVDLYREPSGIYEVQRRMPARTVIVEYRLLEDRLLSWVVRRHGVRPHSSGIGRPALTALVARLYAAIDQDRPRAELLSALSALQACLIGPLRQDLRAGDDLVFVPDRALAAVPFAALRDGTTGRFLVQDFAIGVSPSAGSYLRAVEHDRQLARRAAPSALVVSNPTFNPELFPGLPGLAGAEEEGKAVAAIYPGSETLAGTAATKPRFLAALGRHAVMHFAGHALTPGDNPLTAVLPFAPAGPRDSGALYAHELLGRSFSDLRLVTLASCTTTGTAGSRAARIAGFVRPLLGGGVPTVVGSLWAVEDRATAQLFGIFHRRFRAGDDAAHALQTAQLALLLSRDETRNSPALWAAFEVFGGSAPAQASPAPAGSAYGDTTPGGHKGRL